MGTWYKWWVSSEPGHLAMMKSKQSGDHAVISRGWERQGKKEPGHCVLGLTQKPPDQLPCCRPSPSRPFWTTFSDSSSLKTQDFSKQTNLPLILCFCKIVPDVPLQHDCPKAQHGPASAPTCPGPNSVQSLPISLWTRSHSTFPRVCPTSPALGTP